MRRTEPWYWVVTSYGGRLVIIGPKSTESEATEFGYLKLDTEFKVVPLATRDRARATSQIKAKRLDITGDLGGALKFAMHQPPKPPKSSESQQPAPASNSEREW